MNYSLSHLSDQVLLQGLASIVGDDRATTAALLAHLAEVDARKLFLPAAYPSMFLYCVHELRMSRGAAYKRINASRLARRYPAIFHAIADGRLHLTAVNLLGPYLISGCGPELLDAAAGKTEHEIELLLAERFPRTDELSLVETVQLPSCQLSARRVGMTETEHAVRSELNSESSDRGGLSAIEDSPAPRGSPAAEVTRAPEASSAEEVDPADAVVSALAGSGSENAGPADVTHSHPAEIEVGRFGPPPNRRHWDQSRVTPLSSRSYSLHVTLEKNTYDILCYATQLLSHQIPSGDPGAVVARALEVLVRDLERRKFGVAKKPRDGAA